MKAKALELKLIKQDRQMGVGGLTLSHEDLQPQHKVDLRDPKPLLQQGPDSQLGPAFLHIAIGIMAHLLAQIGLGILMVTLDTHSQN